MKKYRQKKEVLKILYAANTRSADLSLSEGVINRPQQSSLNTPASITALVRLPKEEIRQNKTSQITRIFRHHLLNLTSKDINQTYRRSEEFAIALLNKVGHAMGKALPILIQLLNLRVIVLSGNHADANQHIPVPIQHALNRYYLKISINKHLSLLQRGQAC
ncbi:hypothetical protein [Sunxiuqinia sp. sy24]|uniref:hypothetical protein n=1 Tax=Sunxiuqinia sp. sy24 TaxID=3461495 RepID=UPI0040459F26